jgi:succinate dehydrogenase / fumarate reductase cytochrome b subunit
MQLLPKSSIGKKMVMAVTGQVMVIFVVMHVLGNLTIYFGGLNAYAEHLHALPLLVWANRLVMIPLLLLHVLIGIQLYLEDRSARPETYAVNKSLSTTFAGKTMIWTGLLTGVFLIYHLLHFTIQTIYPDISSSMNMDAMGRPDVFRMVMISFQNFLISFIYILSMTALFLHLSHGIQSSFQSLGLNNEDTLPVISKIGSVVAVVLSVGLASIPFIILIGILKG